MNGWREVVPPPRPYVMVFHRELRNRLQIMVLALESNGVFRVLSTVNHGTRRRIRMREGDAFATDALADLVVRTCVQWDAVNLTLSASQNVLATRYYYLTATRKVSEALSREALFALLAREELGWETQVWEEMPDMCSLAEWRPILDVLGFPGENDVIQQANKRAEACIRL